MGVGAMAVPVRNAHGEAVAALGLSCVAERFESFRSAYEPFLKAMGTAYGKMISGEPDAAVEVATRPQGSGDAVAFASKAAQIGS